MVIRDAIKTPGNKLKTNSTDSIRYINYINYYVLIIPIDFITLAFNITFKPIQIIY